MTKCHWVYDDHLTSFIPNCIGGAVNGPEGCTCDTSLSEIEQARKSLDESRAYVIVLRKKSRQRQLYVDSIIRYNHRLYIENRQLKEVAGE